jgi:hypothetical protein
MNQWSQIEANIHPFDDELQAIKRWPLGFANASCARV